MNVAWLWLRAHHWPKLVVFCSAIALVHAAFGARELPVPALRSIAALSLPVGQFLPLLLACGVGLFVRPPTGLFDNTPRAQSLVRLGVVAAAHLPAVLACLPLLQEEAHIWQVAMRNTLGLTGLALLTVVVAGATRSWTVPLFHMFVSMIFGTSDSGVIGGSPVAALWAFPVAPAHSATALGLVAVLWAAGTAAYVVSGSRLEQATP